MKRELLLLFLLAVGFVSCEKKVEGVATYEIKLVGMSASKMISRGSEVDLLYQDYTKSLNEIAKKYSKTWDYPFSGETYTEALASEDKKAAANFDAAVAEYEALAKRLKDTQIGLKGGSFKDVSCFKIIRIGETVKESKELVFEYPSSKE